MTQIELKLGDRVQVHKNLNRQRQNHPEQWSVKTRQTRINKKGKKVTTWYLVTHLASVSLINCLPITSARSASRIRCHADPDPTARGACHDREGDREVIAKIEGNLTSDIFAEECDREVHYNPFRCDDFTFNDGSVYVGSQLTHFPEKSSYFLSV